MQALENGEEGVGSFQIVSAILKNRDKGPSAADVITSGRAPLMPGSKAVVAAMLEPAGGDAAVGLALQSHVGRVGRDSRATTKPR